MRDPHRVSWPYLATRFLYRIYFRRRHRWRVEGAENVPADGGVLLFSNHASYLDPPLIGSALERPIRAMAKVELFRWPLFSWWITHLGAFPIRRGGADREAIRDALAILAHGEALLIFPEGTRTPDGNLLPFQAGAGMIALRAGVPVIPVRIRGSFEAWGKGRRWIRPAPISVRFGPPIDLSDLPRQGREAYEAAAARIRAAVEAL